MPQRARARTDHGALTLAQTIQLIASLQDCPHIARRYAPDLERVLRTAARRSCALEFDAEAIALFAGLLEVLTDDFSESLQQLAEDALSGAFAALVMMRRHGRLTSSWHNAALIVNLMLAAQAFCVRCQRGYIVVDAQCLKPAARSCSVTKRIHW